MTESINTKALRDVEGADRDELVSRVNTLCDAVELLAALRKRNDAPDADAYDEWERCVEVVAKLTVARSAYYSQLTRVQGACSELRQETRAKDREIAALKEKVDALEEELTALVVETRRERNALPIAEADRKTTLELHNLGEHV